MPHNYHEAVLFNVVPGQYEVFTIVWKCDWLLPLYMPASLGNLSDAVFDVGEHIVIMRLVGEFYHSSWLITCVLRAK